MKNNAIQYYILPYKTTTLFLWKCRISVQCLAETRSPERISVYMTFVLPFRVSSKTAEVKIKKQY